MNPKQAAGVKRLPLHYVPPTFICATARALWEGGDKYGPYNWRDQPVETMTYAGALLRHLMAWIDGEDVDPESPSGKSHLDGIAGSAAILIDAIESGYAIDNRPKKGASPDMIRAATRKPGAVHLQPAVPYVADGWNVPLSEPRTTDYCGQCGDSPDSGAHVFDHAYVDLRKP